MIQVKPFNLKHLNNRQCRLSTKLVALTHEYFSATNSQRNVVVERHHFREEKVALVELIDQNVELLQKLIDLGWINRFSSISKNLQFPGDMSETLREYSGAQVEVNSRSAYDYQTHCAVEDERAKVSLKNWEIFFGEIKFSTE